MCNGILDLRVTFAQMTQIATGALHSCALQSNGAVYCWGGNTNGQLGDGTVINQTRAIQVPSFTLNIDPLVTLKGNTRVATVNVVATCEEGGQLHVNVRLVQGSASGVGVGQGQCSGGMERYPVTVAAQGRNTFLNGAAEVEAEAIIREWGTIVDQQEWTRQVNIEVSR